MNRCSWAGDDPIYTDYHDHEWGKPLHDDRLLFEFLVLETFQAGLAWITILAKRPAFREAFDNFDVDKVAGFDEDKVTSLMNNPGIVRNQLKIRAAINNAKMYQKIQRKYGSFDSYIWGFVHGEPVISSYSSASEVPAYTQLAEQITRDLKSKGLKFVGPTIVYSYMQATGLVNDHSLDCNFRLA